MPPKETRTKADGNPSTALIRRQCASTRRRKNANSGLNRTRKSTRGWKNCEARSRNSESESNETQTETQAGPVRRTRRCDRKGLGGRVRDAAAGSTGKTQKQEPGTYERGNQPAVEARTPLGLASFATQFPFHTTDTFRDGALEAVNLGEDADTTGAIYGQIAGAYYGAEAIPQEWRDRLAMRAQITSYADRLFAQYDNLVGQR